MTLADLENTCLLNLQQPGANPGGTPNWGSLVNPAFNQATVDQFINLGYTKLMGDIAELELVDTTFTFLTTVNTFTYSAVPTGTNPQAVRVNRIFYAPTGLTYTKEYKPGLELISWREFQEQTGWGYFLQTGASSATLPTYWSVNPGRQQLWAYPGTANANDTVTVRYAPLPTKGAAVCPTLVNAGDTPLPPSDTHEAIADWALYWLFVKARDFQAADYYKKAYFEELARIKSIYSRASLGDSNAWDMGDIMPSLADAGIRAIP